ncbi:TIGR03773 family transporter-associated surface protein [Nakamurella leprariae]|uniref:TIGR03773 family transporter-associated surface protein n=1 Tax=Nakamurella leprariae TaxID=2803911 RepID=A0A939C3E2_9ACTN|nr:TIGR03773 family transporter-associated surface protein [Nakamurella leprariae]MBM9469329.1 TIGR03773 family transporter-associated surface protein [Nakamurella leprariae]
MSFLPPRKGRRPVVPPALLTVLVAALVAVLTAALSVITVPSGAVAHAEPGAAPSEQAGPAVVDRGRVDVFRLGMTGTDLTLSTGAAAGPGSDPSAAWVQQIVGRDPSGVVFHLPDIAGDRVGRTVVPAGSFEFIAPEGDPVWVLPVQGTDSSLLAGWEARSVGAGVLQDDLVTLELLDAQVPAGARLEVFTTEPLGDPVRLLSTQDRALRSVPVRAGTQADASWAFTALGTYRLTVQATGTTVDGETLRSAAQEFTFVVGDLPAVPAEASSAAADRTAGPNPSVQVLARAMQAPAPAAVPAPAAAPVACPSPQVFTEGHFDFGSQFDGTLHSRIKTDDQGWLEPRTVVFHVGDPAEVTMPAGYEFVAAAGTRAWQIPQTQAPGIPWLGWNTQDRTIAGQVDGPVTMTLAGVDGPGELAVFLQGSFGGVGTRVMDTVGGPTSYDIPVGATGVHAHGNWVFTAPGVYRVSITQSATIRGAVQRDTETLNFLVGPGDPLTAAAPCGSGAPAAPDAGTPAAPGGSAPAAPAAPGQPAAPGAGGGTSSAAAAGGGSAASSSAAACIPTPVTSVVTRPGGASGPAPSAPPAAGVERLADGHYDFGPQFVDGQLRPMVKTDDRGWLDPASVEFVVGDSARTALPQGDGYSFIGDAGAQVWMIPQTQAAGIPWLGWNTQHETIKGHVTGPITMQLDSVEGPGSVAVFLTGTFGGVGQRIMDDVGGPTSHDIEVGATGVHVHGNWVFTEPGRYRVTLSFSGVIDGAPAAGTAVLTFAVGDGIAAAAPSTQPAAVPLDGAPVTETVVSTVGRDAVGRACQLAAGGSTDGALGNTGAAIGLPLAIGAVLLLSGVGLLVRGRRSRAAHR